jgi:dTDP-4-amino-4,6-dideoxygalactose transaminase
MNNAFWVGVQPELSQEQLDYIVESFADFLGRGL